MFAEDYTFYAINTDYNMKLGDKITMIRKQKNMSQVELAEKTTISRDGISKYERGDIVPSVEYAKRIADTLGVSLDYLVSEDAKDDALDKDAIKRIKDIQKLPEQEKEKVLTVIDALVRDFKTRKAYAS
jgi:transcriptional regulator with XRE-family HTH domain